MQIKQIKLRNVMSHNATTLSLSSTGIYVLCGANGAGKSTFIEAPAYALGGETLRGTTPFRPDTEGSLEVVTNLGSIVRGVSAAGAKKVAWAPTAEGHAILQKADTNTKTNDQISLVFGDFDIWRRTHVFSSADAHNFTMATDAERKRLIEQLLGLERFDEASKVVHGQLNDARKALMTAQYAYQTAKQTVAQTRALLATHDDARPKPFLMPEPPQSPALSIQELRDELDDVRHLLKMHKQQASAVHRDSLRTVLETDAELALHPQIREAEHQVRDTERELALANAGQCGTCGAPYAGDARAVANAVTAARAALKGLQNTLAQLVAARKEMMAAEAVKVDEATRALTEMTTREQQLVADIARVQSEQARYDQHQQHCAELTAQYQQDLSRWQSRRDAIEAPLAQQQVAVVDAFRKEEEQEALVAELAVCDQVLGLKGVRVAVLAKALEATEQLANLSLMQMGSDIRVQLRSFSETKKGTTNSNISIEVTGAGAGYGYKASSGGERRRIDAALLLAFAEVAEASFGRSGGTLFLDEVFDALDADGCSGIVSVLTDLAQRRCLVVITHRPELAWLLQQGGATAYNVQAGSLSLLGAS